MNNNPLINAREQIKSACDILGYKEEVYESKCNSYGRRPCQYQ